MSLPVLSPAEISRLAKIAQLERIFAAPAAQSRGNPLAFLLLLVSGPLKSTWGVTREMQFGNMALRRLGFTQEAVTLVRETWSEGAANYFMEMSTRIFDVNHKFPEEIRSEYTTSLLRDTLRRAASTTEIREKIKLYRALLQSDDAETRNYAYRQIARAKQELEEAQAQEGGDGGGDCKDIADRMRSRGWKALRPDQHLTPAEIAGADAVVFKDKCGVTWWRKNTGNLR